MIVEVKVPAAGESVQEAIVSVILLNNGDIVAEDDPILELETDKASMPVLASAGGRVEVLAEEGATVAVGDVIAKIDTDAAGEVASKAPEEAKAAEPEKTEEAPQTEAPAEQKTSAPEASASTHVHTGDASPSAAGLMQAHQIDASQVEGTGLGGRITKEDVIQEIKNPRPRASQSYPEPPMPNFGFDPSLPKPIVGERETKKKMTNLRKVIAKRLVDAQHDAAMLTTFNEVDMTSVMSLRAKYKERFKEQYGIGLGFMSFFVKATVEALKSCPDINAYIDGDDIVHRNYYDVSIAVSTPRGLVVPVVRDCDQLSFAEVEKSIVEYAVKGREGKLTMEEMQGGGFTITNGGIFGSLLSTPILNPPQCAILGMHKIEKRAVVENDQVVIRPMMYLALSYDHRLVDGREAVTFLVKIKECIEDPAKIMLEL